MFLSTLKAIFEAVAKIFGCKDTAIQRQSETAVVKHLKNAEKACNIAEQIIFLVDRKNDISEELFAKTYKKLRKRFFKYN